MIYERICWTCSKPLPADRAIACNFECMLPLLEVDQDGCPLDWEDCPDPEPDLDEWSDYQDE